MGTAATAALNLHNEPPSAFVVPGLDSGGIVTGLSNTSDSSNSYNCSQDLHTLPIYSSSNSFKEAYPYSRTSPYFASNELLHNLHKLFLERQQRFCSSQGSDRLEG